MGRNTHNRLEEMIAMAAKQWFVYPVENGVELVIDSADGEVLDTALAEFVEVHTDCNIAAEWTSGRGHVIHFVPAPAEADLGARPSNLPADAV